MHLICAYLFENENDRTSNGMEWNEMEWWGMGKKQKAWMYALYNEITPEKVIISVWYRIMLVVFH